MADKNNSQPDVNEQKLPYLGVLIKKDEDLETVVRMNL